MGQGVFKVQCFSVEGEDSISTHSHSAIMGNVVEGEKTEK